MATGEQQKDPDVGGALRGAVRGSKASGQHGGSMTVAQQQKQVSTLLADPRIKAQMALALPKHVTADRLLRIVLTEVRRVPKLAECASASLLGSVMQCAQLGLEPGGVLGHCYILPYWNKRKNCLEAQFMLGYRGMIDLARRSDQIVSISPRAVYAADAFRVEFGLHEELKHVPKWDEADRGPLTFVYAVANLKGGGQQFDVMSRADVERVRLKSQSPDSGPWVEHFEAMALKSVIRRLFKMLPVSIEYQRAMMRDEHADAGLPQGSMLDDADDVLIDGETGQVIGTEGRPAAEPERTVQTERAAPKKPKAGGASAASDDPDAGFGELAP